MFSCIFRKLRCNPQRVVFASFCRAMGDSIEEESLYYSHERLTEIIQSKGTCSGESAVKEYLSKVKYKSVSDFKKGNYLL